MLGLSLRRFVLTLLALLALAGCVSPVALTKMPSAPTVQNPAPSAANADMVLAVVQDLEPVTERICLAQNPYRNCDFQMLVDDTPGSAANAYQTQDRRGRPLIAFTTAMLTTVENSDEFAFVLAHEASHHILGHLDRTRRNAQIGAEIFGGLAGVAGTGIPDDIQAARELGAEVAARAYSKEFELEADRLATRILMAAGYDPIRGAYFFSRLPDPGDRFLGTHPANRDRVAAVYQTVQDVQAGR